jgi:hypothetical protein
MNPEPKLGDCLFGVLLFLFSSKNLSRNGLNSSGILDMSGITLVVEFIFFVACTITTAGIFFSTTSVKLGKAGFEYNELE